MNVCILLLERSINFAFLLNPVILRLGLTMITCRVSDNKLTVANVQNLAIKYHLKVICSLFYITKGLIYCLLYKLTF